MHTIPLQAIVFDFDGTLAALTIDFDAMREQVAALAAEHLTPPPVADGLPVLEWVEALSKRIAAGEGGPDEARAFCARCARMIVDMETRAATRGRLFAYTRPVLAGLRGRGLKTAIITRNCTSAVTAVFPDARSLCDCLLTRDDVARAKPDPQHMRAALARLGVEPGNALMVGDHPLDVQTGRFAGTRTAGVASGRISTAELLRAGADFVAADCLQLARALTRSGLIP